jgi:hypothetical protein
LKNWDDEIHSALSHPIRRHILECLRERSALSFQELVKCVRISNHGKLGFHVRSLKGLVERDRSIKKFRLTDRGQLAAELLWDIRFVISRGGRDLAYEPTRYVRSLNFGDHAFLMYDTDDVKRQVTYSFLEAGLAKDEAVVYLVPENKLDSESREIQRYGISDEVFRKKMVAILSADEWYLRKGKAQAKTIIANWQKLARQWQKVGFKGVRTAGDMEVFFDSAKIKELFRYEVMVGRQLPPYLCGLCIYDQKLLDDKQVYHLIKCHGHFINRDWAWKMT